MALFSCLQRSRHVFVRFTQNHNVLSEEERKKPLRCEILKRFPKKAIQQKWLFVRRVFIMGFYSCVFQHILIMHVNDSLQPLFVLTHSYSDPKTLLIFHFLYLFFTDRPLCSCFLPQKDQRYVLLRSVNFIISRGCDFSCSALLFY